MACTKKRFNSEAEAEQFATQHEAEYGPQRVYACENCNYYHLTSTGSGLMTPVITNYKAIENMALPPKSAPPSSADIAEMRRLRAQGMSRNAIAAQTGFSGPTVAKYTDVDYGVARLDSVSTKKLRLEEQLRRLAEEQKQLEDEERRLIEESKLKVELTGDVVLVHKNMKGITLTLADCNELHAALGKILSDVVAQQGLIAAAPITEATSTSAA